MVQYTVHPVTSLILSGNMVFFQFSFFLSSSNLFLFISLSQAPVDNGSKITSYLLEWDEVILFFFFVHRKDFKRFIIIIIEFVFTFLVKGPR